jgi:hypothetical protein
MFGLIVQQVGQISPLMQSAKSSGEILGNYGRLTKRKYDISVNGEQILHPKTECHQPPISNGGDPI